MTETDGGAPITVLCGSSPRCDRRTLAERILQSLLVRQEHAIAPQRNVECRVDTLQCRQVRILVGGGDSVARVRAKWALEGAVAYGLLDF
jgi:hypothetical protein